MNLSVFDKILAALEMGAAIASSIPSPIAGAGKLADYFLKIAQAAVKAHESITGQPLDMTKLHEIEPVA